MLRRGFPFLFFNRLFTGIDCGVCPEDWHTLSQIQSPGPLRGLDNPELVDQS